MTETTSAELTEWMAYYTLEPFGDGVADMRHGISTATLANVNRDSKARPEPYLPEDFVPWQQRRAKKPYEGEFIADPEAQSALIKKRLFKSVK